MSVHVGSSPRLRRGGTCPNLCPHLGTRRDASKLGTTAATSLGTDRKNKKNFDLERLAEKGYLSEYDKVRQSRRENPRNHKAKIDCRGQKTKGKQPETMLRKKPSWHHTKSAIPTHDTCPNPQTTGTQILASTRDITSPDLEPQALPPLSQDPFHPSQLRHYKKRRIDNSNASLQPTHTDPTQWHATLESPA
ncbi:uncharacterized protein CLUP02_14663 [Colletotrichum lupini]|uniref:Uncharacterized protein n=1 Tax=Colletotrichum lupini TaxID=145971 RepID=A0A9Q8WNI2_9PEZI|nr:uncharacterized protein CLUP02_14663 [Colletotrichum lupini]UQC89135.1 hypothetical protein CLUP02_14663 [Colletotrichum lupini]